MIHVATPERADIPEEQALDELTQAHSAVLRNLQTRDWAACGRRFRAP